MNLEFKEILDKVVVVNEYGVKTERKNTNNIREILINENKLEIINDTIKEYNEELVKNRLYINKLINIISMITLIPMKLYTLCLVLVEICFSIISNFGDFIKFLSPIILIPSLGIIALNVIPKRKKEENKQIEYLLENLNNEKNKIEQILTELKINEKQKENENLKFANNKIISLEEENLDYIFDVADKTIVFEKEVKPKTLKLLKK